MTGPVLVAKTPAAGSSAVSVGANFQLTFDEDVEAGAAYGKVEIWRVHGAAFEQQIYSADSTQVSFSGNIVTINPALNLADDVDYYRRCREVFIKPPEMPQRYNTPVKWGCPYDCGLCTDHEQHSCVSLVEIADFCNLRCPICQVGTGTLPHGRGLMTYEMFAEILEEIGDYLFEIEYYRYGEPLTNRELPRMVALSRDYGIRTKISTNLLLLTPAMARSLVEAGLDILVACADGADQEVYVQYRRRGKFDKFMELLKMLIETKRQLGR